MPKSGRFLVLLLAGIMLDGLATKSTAISCSTVNQQVAPCLGFITDKADKPSAQCCSGAKQMAESAKTKADRQAICECIKTALSGINNVDYDRISQMPKLCGIDVTLPPINKDTDCKSVQLRDLFA